MRNYMDITGFVLGWFAILTQFVLFLQISQTEVLETIIRFFSYFTILTNILVVLFFTFRIPIFKKNYFSKNGTMTALTAFILVVGLVYQFILRNTWHPTGLQRVVDELLHSVIPIFMLFYWIKYGIKKDLWLENIKIWFWYPIVYFVFIIIRGYFSNFYPYPFINASEIGYPEALFNTLLVSLFFLGIMGVLIVIGKKIHKE